MLEENYIQIDAKNKILKILEPPPGNLLIWNHWQSL